MTLDTDREASNSKIDRKQREEKREESPYPHSSHTDPNGKSKTASLKPKLSFTEIGKSGEEEKGKYEKITGHSSTLPAWFLLPL